MKREKEEDGENANIIRECKKKKKVTNIYNKYRNGKIGNGKK